MKKIFPFGLPFTLPFIPLTVAISLLTHLKFAQAENNCNDHVVISQIYGGGGNSGATYKNDFIELYNPMEKDISVNGWSVQYASATGSFSSLNTTNLSGAIKAKSYYLIAGAKGKEGIDNLPNPDILSEINLATDKGKIALVDNTEIISSKNDSNVVDFVGYGNAANDYEGTGAAPSPSNTQSIIRYQSCLDSNDNNADFKKENPSPRNSNVTERNKEETPSDEKPMENAENNNNNGDVAPDMSYLCNATSPNIRLNEIFPYPETGKQEFVELKNFGDNCVDLSSWTIRDEKGNKYTFEPGTLIEPKELWYEYGNFYLNNTASETIYLLDSSGKEIDKVSFNKAIKKYSFSFDGEKFLWTSFPTPGKENIFNADKENEKDSSNSSNSGTKNENGTTNKNIYLNEIFPNPQNNPNNEYIEIASGESKPVDLFGWRLKDRSKSKGYQFKEHIILNPGEYFVIYRSETKLALNNSNESVYLSNPQGEITSSASFEKSPKGTSYNFDGKSWKWSQYLTPGKKNKFDSEPKVRIKKPKNVFKNTFTKFSARARDKETKKLKYVWDFGDGKKSHLKKTFHKYLDTGKYKVTLSVTDNSQTIEKNFLINVKKYPRADVEIVKIIPNPKGNDSEGEIIDLQNNSKKEVNLNGWKIATGSGEKLYNHLISDEITLKPGETKTVTREMCKFSLNNKAGKIQLIALDGKVINEIKYQKEKIADDEAYEKIGTEWKWIAPNTPEKKNADDSEEADNSEETGSEELDKQSDGEILDATDKKTPNPTPALPGYTSEDKFTFYKAFGLLEYKPREKNYCPLNQPLIIFAYF